MKAQIALLFLRDTSLSMQPNAAVYESSMREYLESLRKDPNADYKIILVDFNTDARIQVIGARLDNFLLGDYNPNGASTNLYDAVFTATDAADAWLKRESEAGRNYNVLFWVLTDGEHNHTPVKEPTGIKVLNACKHTLDDVKAKFTEKEKTGFWTVAYLGANQDAWAVAGSMGVASASNYVANAAGIKSGIGNLQASTLTYSSRTAKGASVPTSDFWQDDAKK